MPKRSRKVTPRQVALKKRQRNGLKKHRNQYNPFNRITAKNLHNSVLGQRVKGNVRKPGHSISRSIEKRKQTLLKEYNAIETNQHNTFIDKRYEKTLENKLLKLKFNKNNKMNRDKKAIEKIIKKLTSQRLKSNKKVLFNLDDNNDTFTLTHLGAPINENTIMDNYEYDDDDNDNKYLYKGFNKHNIYEMIKNKQMTFEQIADSAGISINKYENKTKPQIIKSHILRSRYKKCMEQIAKEGIMDETEMVDNKFRETSKWLLDNRSNKNNTINNNNNKKNSKLKMNDMQYQEKLMEFENDKRSNVTDKIVSDTQKAQHNYEMLSEMEKERQQTLLMIDGDDELKKESEQSEDNEQEQIENENKTETETDWNQILEQIAAESDTDSESNVADDVVNEIDNDIDGYYADIDTQFLPPKNSNNRNNNNNNNNIYMNDFEFDEIEIGEEPAGKGEHNIFDIVKDKEIKRKENEMLDKLNKKLEIIKDFDWNVLDLNKECTNIIGNKLQDIAYTLDIPENIAQFEALMNGKTASQQITLLKRMRSTNHVKLNENNKFKIQRLYDMLLDYFRKLCINYLPTKAEMHQDKDIQFYQYIDVITRALFALSHDIPEYAYSTHIKKLEIISIHIQKNYNLKSNTHYKNENMSTNISYMPSGYALFYLKLVSNIFPKENKSNPLICSVLLILCKCITNIAINGARDILCYLFCITLILEIIKNENRYVPEIIHSLHNLLNAGFLANETFKKIKENSFNLLKETNDLYFTFCKGSNIWNDNLQKDTQNINSLQLQLPIRYIFLQTNDENIFHTQQFKLQSLYTTLKIIFKCHQIWNSLLSYSEIFKPFYNLLLTDTIKYKINSTNNKQLVDLYDNLLSCLKHKIFMQSLTRKPLQLIHKKKPIPSLEPDFDPDLKPSFLRLKVRNVTALEKKKKRILKKAIKKQQKAVIKELQKDTQFIMNEKTKNRIDMDNKRHAKWAHEWHNLTQQQQDTNSFQMVGKKLRKRLIKKGVIRGF